MIVKAVEENEDLRDNLSAAAHLMHGSPEDRFTVTYCPGHISKEDVESVGFNYGDIAEMSSKYDITKLKSFEGIEKWLTELRDHGSEHMCTMLIGNKSDLAKDRQVEFEDA